MLPQVRKCGQGSFLDAQKRGCKIHRITVFAAVNKFGSMSESTLGHLGEKRTELKYLSMSAILAPYLENKLEIFYLKNSATLCLTHNTLISTYWARNGSFACSHLEFTPGI